MKRIALALTGWPDRVRTMVKAACLAEERGFDMVWVAEDYFTGRDGVTPLACIAFSTEKVKLGTCVTSLYTRSPGLIAATMATLDELSEGRMVLGLGAGLGWVSMFSMDPSQMKPIETMTESTRLIRALFSNRAVTFHGKNLTIRGDPYWWPDGVVRPVRDRIPIYVGARRPKMNRLTAEIADGLIIEVGIPVPIVKKRIEQFRACAQRAGRDPDQLDISCLIAVSVCEDPYADEAMRRFVASRIAKIDEFRRTNEKSPELCGVDEEEVKTVQEAFRRGGLGEASTHVSEESIDAYAASGSSEKCIQRIQEYVAAGVKLPTIVSIGRDIDRTIRIGGKYATETT